MGVSLRSHINSRRPPQQNGCRNPPFNCREACLDMCTHESLVNSFDHIWEGLRRLYKEIKGEESLEEPTENKGRVPSKIATCRRYGRDFAERSRRR